MKNRVIQMINVATRRWARLALVALAGWTFLAKAEEATTLTAAEREEAIGQLEESRKKFLAAIAGLSEQQWNFKPAPDRWSAAECAEHIAVTEAGAFRLITGQIMNSPAEQEKKSSRRPDGSIRPLMLDRSRKAQANEMLRPIGRWKTQQQLDQAFSEVRNQTIAYVRDTKDDLRSHFGPHPALGPLDAYQWILFLSAHCERHTLQIAEVKADPKFPRD